MRYRVVVFGVKDTSEQIIEYIHNTLRPVDLVITIAREVQARNQIAGYQGLSYFTEKYGIPVFEAGSYTLDDAATRRLIGENSFELGIVMGWQRLVPRYVLDAFEKGVYGFHGNCGYLPFGRGRSPLNWSMLLGDTRFNLNLFRYDEKADSPNVFATEMFSINAHDDIRTAQYKSIICSRHLLHRLIRCYEQGGEIPIRTSSRDYDSWYEKRTAKDGRIDFRRRTRDIYNLIRAVTRPFPGAFCFVDGDGAKKAIVWEAHPFDEMIDFSAYAPGEIIDVFDDRPVVRTVDGSLIIDRYECDAALSKGMILC